MNDKSTSVSKVAAVRATYRPRVAFPSAHRAAGLTGRGQLGYGSSSALAEDLCLFRGELRVGENAPLLQVGKLGETLDRVRSLLCRRLG
jgi:hypothetical protein